MSILKKIFGLEDKPSQDAIVITQTEVKTEVKKKEQKPEFVNGDQPLVGK